MENTEQKITTDDFWGEPISVYTREDAINDGDLVDVSETAKEAGIKFPVAVTSNLYHTHINPDPMPAGQDNEGRLWDVIWMLRMAIRKSEGSFIEYKVIFVNKDNERETIKLFAACEATSPTDPRPAITIMLPEDY